MNNKLISQVRKEQSDKAELIEKEYIRKMLALIEQKDTTIKLSQEATELLKKNKAEIEKMLEARDYSVLSQGWSYTMPNYMKLPSSLEDVLKFRRG